MWMTYDITDLYDWAKASEINNSTTVTIKKGLLQRQNSKTGSVVQVNEVKVALFRCGKTVYAVNEKCPHAGGPLHLGDIECLPDRSLCVRCPWHSWRFDLRTGEVRKPRGRGVCLPVYPTRVLDDGSIQVGFQEFDQKYFTNEDF